MGKAVSQHRNRGRYLIQWGLAIGLGVGRLGEVLPPGPGISLGVPPAVATTDFDPFAHQGLVFVLHQGQWREAVILSGTRRVMDGGRVWVYQVQFLDGAMELRAHIPADQMLTLAQAQASGVTPKVYDLASQAGMDEILAAHNHLRRQVGVRSLTWSSELAASAQQWADFLVAQNAFYHSPDNRRRRGTIGENLHRRRASPGRSYATPSQAVAGWIAEQHHYTYTTNRCTPGQQCGHYLQMVWGDTRQVGCALSRTRDARLEVWACHYYPGGIVLNRRPY